MSTNKLSIFKLLLFLAGAVIIILAFFMTTKNHGLSQTDVFVWSSIGLMYLVFFLPFFFSSINISNFSGKIPVLSIIWLGILLYIAASITVIILHAVIKIIPIELAVLIQVILFFLFLVDIYFGYFASSHVSKVAAQEADMQQYIKQIKPKAQSLLLSVNTLPSEYENAQKTLKKVLEDIKYIYPVDKGAGDNLELQIIESLNTVSELCAGISSGAHSTALEQEANKLLILTKERKLLRN